MNKSYKIFIPTIFLFLFVTCNPSGIEAEVNISKIEGHIQNQINFGARIPGSGASIETANYIKDELNKQGWDVKFQLFHYKNTLIRNVMAKNSSASPDIMLGAHFDTREFSDQENSNLNRSQPVPGANDGASGTALLLELGRLLNSSTKSIWLVFFDAEDQGEINGWEWSVGAEYFANALPEIPKEVVIVDMIGDKDLNIFLERNSDSHLCEEIWGVAKDLGYKNLFIQEQKYSMIDDHIPLVQKGIPTCLIIDFDYPYWHTNQDTIKNISFQSIKVVGDVLYEWIVSNND